MASTTTASPTLAHTDLEAILGSMYLGGMGAAMYVWITYNFILCWTYTRIGFSVSRCFKFISISEIIEKTGYF